MRNITLIIIIVIPYYTYCQPNDNTAYFFKDNSKVRAFISHTSTKHIRFYSQPEGEIVDSIPNPQAYDWVCINIKSYQSKWTKVDAVGIFPGEDTLFSNLKNLWLPIHNLYLNLSNDSNQIYSKPSKKSPLMNIGYQSVQLLEIKKQWVRVKLIENKQEFTGWIPYKNLCYLPWTTCN